MYKIGHVHIKDKNSENENTILGTGLVDFEKVFDAFKDIGYEGPFTFETTRGSNPLNTAVYNMKLVEFFKGSFDKSFFLALLNKSLTAIKRDLDKSL